MMNGSARSRRGSRIAVVGAGVAGLTVAKRLADLGFAVTVFERSRGVGGRMANRRVGASRFDHGTPFIAARGTAFRSLLRDLELREFVAPWRPRWVRLTGGERGEIPQRPDCYVGTHAMNEFTHYLSSFVEVKRETSVVSLKRSDGRWRLTGQKGSLGTYDAVLLAIPAPQAAALIADHKPEWAELAGQVEYRPSWALLVTFTKALGLGFDAAFCESSPLAFVVREASKPGRPKLPCWVIHATPEWASERLNEKPEIVARQLCQAFFEVTGCQPVPRLIEQAHRWRYANCDFEVKEQALHCPELGLGLCGDWCAGGGVEGAFLSGAALARKLSSVNLGTEKIVHAD